MEEAHAVQVGRGKHGMETNSTILAELDAVG